MAIDTGHGASITFSTTGGTWLCRQIAGPTVTRDPVETTHLQTAVRKTYMAGDLEDTEPVTIEILFQGSQGLPARSSVPETVTITHPTVPGGATPATLAGTALIIGGKYPDFQTNTLQTGQITFRYDGGTGPTYTAAT